MFHYQSEVTCGYRLCSFKGSFTAVDEHRYFTRDEGARAGTNSPSLQDIPDVEDQTIDHEE